MKRDLDIELDERATWLRQLSEALHQAQMLLFELDLSTPRGNDLGDLFQQIEAMQVEVRSFQRRGLRADFPPEWSLFAPATCSKRPGLR